MKINGRLQKSLHTITSESSNRNIPKRFRRKQQRLPLDYNKYLLGRSYQLFKGALRSDKTLQLYKQHLFHFCDFIKMTTEEIVSKFGGGNAKESVKLQRMIEDYAIVLQTKVGIKK